MVALVMVVAILPGGSLSTEVKSPTIPTSDVNLLEFPLNLEYLEAEFFLYGALGYGLDKHAPNLTGGGPTPLGGKQAKLDAFTKDVVFQFALQEVGHLRSVLTCFYACHVLYTNINIKMHGLQMQGYQERSERVSKAIVRFECEILCKNNRCSIWDPT